MLSSSQVCRLAGITYRQLNYWIAMGLVRPAKGDGGGSGVPLRFDQAQVPTIVLAAQLMALGAGAQVAARVVEAWADQPLGAWAGLLFVSSDGGQSHELRAGAAWVVDLSSCVRRLELVAAA